MALWSHLTSTWRGRAIGVLLVATLVFGASYLVLPPTADGLIVTVTMTPPGPPGTLGPTIVIFRRGFGGDTVGAVRADLDRLDRMPLNAGVGCPLDPETTSYTDDFLLTWHGMPVRDYFTQSGDGCGFWYIKTLGIPDLTRSLTVKGTWANLARLTGIPLIDDYQCPDCHLGPN